MSSNPVELHLNWTAAGLPGLEPRM